MNDDSPMAKHRYYDSQPVGGGLRYNDNDRPDQPVLDWPSRRTGRDGTAVSRSRHYSTLLWDVQRTVQYCHVLYRSDSNCVTAGQPCRTPSALQLTAQCGSCLLRIRRMSSSTNTRNGHGRSDHVHYWVRKLEFVRPRASFSHCSEVSCNL